MGRFYLMCIVFAGMFAAMLNTCSSRNHMRTGDQIFREHAGQFEGVGSESKARSGSSTVTSEGTLEIQRSSDGHFYADVQINGSTIHALVDTGASEIALTRADASSAGLATSIGMPEVVGEGAEGAVHGEVVRLDRVALGNTSAEGMPAVVLNSGGQSLLGQSFLSKFESVEIRGDTMVLK